MIERFTLLTAGISAVAISILVGLVGGIVQVPFTYMLNLWAISIVTPVVVIIFAAKQGLGKKVMKKSTVQQSDAVEENPTKDTVPNQEKTVSKQPSSPVPAPPEQPQLQSTPVQPTQIPEKAEKEQDHDWIMIEIRATREQLDRIEAQVANLSKIVIATTETIVALQSRVPTEQRVQDARQPTASSAVDNSKARASPVPINESKPNSEGVQSVPVGGETPQQHVATNGMTVQTPSAKIESNETVVITKKKDYDVARYSKQLDELNQLKQELIKLRSGLMTKLDKTNE